MKQYKMENLQNSNWEKLLKKLLNNFKAVKTLFTLYC